MSDNEDLNPLDKAKVASPVVPAAQPVVKPKKPKAEVAVIAVAQPTKAVPEYRVLKAARVSWGRQMIKLKEGQILSEASYGDGAIEQFKARGVELALVE